MRIIDPKILAATAAERWKSSYWHSHGWTMDFAGPVYDQLLALGSSPDPKDVDRIIGNDSWTRVTCSEIGCNEDACIEVGQPRDYESATAWLCRSCLRKVSSLL